MINLNFGHLLRAMCCLLIVNYHTVGFGPHYLAPFAKGGFILNVIFITMSGFFIAKYYNTNQSIFNWFRKRFVKIFPSLYLTILIFTGPFMIYDI